MDKKIKSETCTHHGKNIEFWRLFNRLTQGELADMIGLNQNQVSKLEKDEVVDEDTLLKISNALGIDIASLKSCNHKHILNTCKGVVNYIYNVQSGATLNQEVGTLNKDNKVEAGGSITTIYQADKTYELYERIIKLTEEISDLKNQLENR